MHLLFKRPRDPTRALALFTAPYQPQARKGVALPLRLSRACVFFSPVSQCTFA